MDDDAPTGDLTDDQAALYWYFWDSRGRNGVPKKTPSMGMYDFHLKWKQLKALMQEIQDAGYWTIGDNGIPQFGPDQPDRPVPTWAEPEDPSALTHAPTHALARSQKLSLKASIRNNVTPLRGVPLVGVPTGQPAKVIHTHMTERQARWMARSFGRDTYALVDEFGIKVRRQYGGFAPGGINSSALGANIKKWMAYEGLSYEMIRAMIEIFVSEPQFIRKGTPAWKSFLAQRQRLLNLAEDRQRRADVDGYWKRGKK